MPKRDALVKAYLDALEARALLIHASPDGRSAKLSFNEDSKLNLFDALWFSKPAHAEFVLANCCQGYHEGWFDLPAREVRDRVINVAAVIGARWRSSAELQADASNAVAEIIEHVEHQRQIGGLCKVNASYKIYRQQQAAKGEKAMPYAAHLAAFTRSLVTLAAQNARPN
jgi:hypothetical protein